MGAEILFEIKALSKSFTKGKSEVPIFSNLNMNIKQGDFLAIMGPSGSGKTTLLNLIGGIDKPTQGTVLYCGREYHDTKESELSAWRAQHVGFVFQSFNLMPMLTAADNVELPLLLRQLTRRQRKEKVMAALELVGLEDRQKHKPNEMSGGQNQRVAVARAIVGDPDILLCDEPTGNLDRKTAAEVLDILRLLNQEYNKTIIMVTHDPLAAQYAKHRLELDKGVIVTQPGHAAHSGEPAIERGVET
jgi:putative ABC transport system ATP-binding protein